MKRKSLNQAGAVSMLSVVVFSLIITVVVTVYLSTVISQRNNALNFDLSTRAYYAAESGIQDAIRGLIVDPTQQSAPKNNCPPLPPGNGIIGAQDTYGLSYTCQQIDPSPTSIPFEIPAETNVLLRLQPDSRAENYRLVLRWSKKLKEGDGATVLQPRESSSRMVPNEASWGDTHPLLRASVLSFPQISNTATVQQRVVYINPVTQSAPGDHGIGVITKTGRQTQESVFQNGKCVSSEAGSNDGFGSGFSCEMTINLNGYQPFDTDALYVRLSSRYRTTQVEVLLTDENGVSLSLKNTVADISVTGRAGNVLRRIKQTVPLQNGLVTDKLPEAAVIAGDGICKLYTIGQDPSQYTNDCTAYETAP